MNDHIPPFLSDVLRHNANSPPTHRPHVTLTFAQSLDAKIAGVGGRQLILSGKESMVMTHWMRTMHDAILVGIGTAINDDPQLNVRQLPHPPVEPYHLPRPIIVDTHLRLPPTGKLLRNYKNGTGRRPWIICSSLPPGNAPEDEKLQRKLALEAAGAEVFEVLPSDVSESPSRLSITSILQILRSHGVKSLMVEGGANIIGSFLKEGTIDAVIITIAPVLVGEAGVGYQYPTLVSENGELVARFKEVRTELVGRDSVVSLVPAYKWSSEIC